MIRSSIAAQKGWPYFSRLSALHSSTQTRRVRRLPSFMTLTPTVDQNPVEHPAHGHRVGDCASFSLFFITGPLSGPASRSTFQVFGANPQGRLSPRPPTVRGRRSSPTSGRLQGLDTITARSGAAFGPGAEKYLARRPAHKHDAHAGFRHEPVGTPHMVTATVRDQCGNPVAGDPVTIPGHRAAPGTRFLPEPHSDERGRSGAFTFTNTVAGDRHDQGPRIIGGRIAMATKTWIAGPPARLTLSPPSATNPVDTQHCVTATVTDTFGNPRPSIVVRFSVTGSVMTGGAARTNAAGQAQFCYTGPPSTGRRCDLARTPTPTTATCRIPASRRHATKTWVLPVSTPGLRDQDHERRLDHRGQRRQVELRRQRQGRRRRQRVRERGVPGSRTCAAVQPAWQRARHRLQQRDLGDHLRRGDDRRIRLAQLPDRRPGSRGAR